MKIAVVLPCNLYSAPFYRRFENILNKNGNKFDLIYWNRSGISEDTSGNSIPFEKKDKLMSGKKSKVFKYIMFSIFVKRRLNTVDYDKVIFLGSYAGTIVLLSNFLRKKYKNKYWLDIRDYSFENFRLYFNVMKKSINNSYATSISSPGFKTFLPNYKGYIQSHNIDRNNIGKILLNKFKIVESNVIRISYIGLVGFYEENKKLILALKNDNRFKLQFYGANSEPLKQFCESNNITNVDFHGRFKPEDTMLFYEKTDIVNNVYGNNNINLRTALSNKLYYATALKIPILVSPNTLMAEIAENYDFGYIFNPNDQKFADNLYNWYKDFLKDTPINKFKELWNKVDSEDLAFENKVNEFLSL